MADLAIAVKANPDFKPTGRGTTPPRSRMVPTFAPQISRNYSPTTVLGSIAVEGLMALGLASAGVAGNLAVSREGFRPADNPARHYRFVSEFLSPSGPTSAVAGRVVDEKSHDEHSNTSSWEKLAETVSWIREASARISRLAAKPDGWKGADSLQASEDAVKDSMALLEKLHIEAPKSTPKISLDNDGEFIFFWKKPGLLASIQIGGDRTYSFFGNDGSGDVVFDSIGLADPMPKEVVSILNSKA